MTELYKARIKAMLIFDVSIDDNSIKTSGNDDIFKELDTALLQQYLKLDDERFKKILSSIIALEMSFREYEHFQEWLVGSVLRDYEKESWVIDKAIDQLEPPFREQWREICAEEPKNRSKCTEAFFDCFKATFVESGIEVIGLPESVN